MVFSGILYISYNNQREQWAYLSQIELPSLVLSSIVGKLYDAADGLIGGKDETDETVLLSYIYSCIFSLHILQVVLHHRSIVVSIGNIAIIFIPFFFQGECLKYFHLKNGAHLSVKNLLSTAEQIPRGRQEAKGECFFRTSQKILKPFLSC